MVVNTRAANFFGTTWICAKSDGAASAAVAASATSAALTPAELTPCHAFDVVCSIREMRRNGFAEDEFVSTIEGSSTYGSR